MDQLIIKVNSLNNESFKKIMFRLISIYYDECSYNEGSLCFNDLLTIYNLFYFLEKGDQEC